MASCPPRDAVAVSPNRCVEKTVVEVNFSVTGLWAPVLPAAHSSGLAADVLGPEEVLVAPELVFVALVAVLAALIGVVAALVRDHVASVA